VARGICYFANDQYECATNDSRDKENYSRNPSLSALPTPSSRWLEGTRALILKSVRF